MDIDSNAEMDQALQIVQLNESEACELMVELDVQKHAETSTDQVCSCPVIGTTEEKPKQSRSTSKVISNEKKRLLNKMQTCFMQTSLSRKLRKVDETSLT